MNSGLTDKQLDEIINIISRYDEIESAVFFGSRALNNHKEASDIDIAIKGSRVTIDIANKVHSLLEETSIPLFFDVINYNSINNEELKSQIDKNGIQFYKNFK